jgi:hypothetical protein
MARSVTGEGVASRDERQAKVRYYAVNCGHLFACGRNKWLTLRALRVLKAVP